MNNKNVQKLKELIPDAFEQDNLDYGKLISILEKTEFGLHWPERNEAVNQCNLLTSCELTPDKAKSIAPTDSGHLLIEGENLETLRCLHSSHKESVKMIYIDPPYNTGNDNVFGYSDKFSVSLREYNSKHIRKKDSKNKATKSDGHFHSKWLTMIYPRLHIAAQLLTEDGVIFVSIDDNEVFNLKHIMDEIFGSKNFVGEMIWVNRTTPNDAAVKFATDHEFILVYAKNKGKCTFKGVEKDLSKYKNPDNDPNGDWIADNPSAASGNENYRFPINNPITGEVYYPPEGRYWAFSPKRIDEWSKSGKMVFPPKKGKRFLLKKYKKELRSKLKPVSSLIQGILTSHGTKEMKKLFPKGSPFKYPKPPELIKFLVKQITDNDDIILDFFAGSGTTAQAVLEVNEEQSTNRKFICVQLDETYTPENKQYKEDFETVFDITIARIRKVIEKINAKSAQKTGVQVMKCTQNIFKK